MKALTQKVPLQNLQQEFSKEALRKKIEERKLRSKSWIKNTINRQLLIDMWRGDTWYYQRMGVSFMIGAFFGFVYFKVFATSFDFTEKTSDVVFIAAVLLTACLCASKEGARCVCFLTMPLIAGKQGRQLATAMMISILISGPLSNIVVNTKVMILSSECTKKLEDDQQRESKEKRFKPLIAILKKLSRVPSPEKFGKKLKDVLVRAQKKVNKVLKDVKWTKAHQKLTEWADKASKVMKHPCCQ